MLSRITNQAQEKLLANYQFFIAHLLALIIFNAATRAVRTHSQCEKIQ